MGSLEPVGLRGDLCSRPFIEREDFPTSGHVFRNLLVLHMLRSGTSSSTGILDVAFKLYLLFIASWLLHLPYRLPALALVRFDVALVIIISALIVLGYSAGENSFDSRTNRLVLLLVAYFIITLPLVQWPGSVLNYGLQRFIKAVVFYYFTVRLTTTHRKLSQLLFVFVICQCFRVLEPLYLHLTQGYWGGAATMLDGEDMVRLSGAPGDVINPNGLAFVVVTIIPFAHYLWTGRVIGRLAYLALLPCLIYVLVLTGSRSGMVALGMTFTVIWFHSHHKVLLATLLLVVLTAVVPRLSANLADRYLSIVSSDTKNAGSAQGRLDGMVLDVAVAAHRPLFGHGLGTSAEANANFRGTNQLSHNLFAEVLQELGLVGMFIFAMLLRSIWTGTQQALATLRNSPTANPLLLRLGRTVRVWLAVSILGSLFTYGLSSYNWYFLAGLADVVTALLEHHATVATTGRRGLAGAVDEPIRDLRSLRRPAAGLGGATHA